MESLIKNENILKDNGTNNDEITKVKEELFHNSGSKKKNDCSNFLLKLYQILENNEYKDIIHWGENGQFFLVKNVHDFTENILPKYFKHNNYSSFIRQLNMYGFHKKKSSQNEHIFIHPNFIKGQKDLIKSIKRKSKKEKNIISNNNKNLFNLKQTDLVPFSNLNNVNAFKNINNNINNNINIRKSSLSNDEDLNLSNSINSLLENNTKPCLPMGLPSFNNCNIDNNINNDNFIKNENINYNNNINCNNNINIDILYGNDKKITKKNLENLLNYLNNSIEINTQKEKQLEIKIERLSKQNEEFIMQNQKMLQEIISKNEYNKKLEAVICFILEMIMSKPKIKNNTEIKNIIISKGNEHNNQIHDVSNNLDNLSIVNFATNQNEISKLYSKNDYIPSGNTLAPFQNFLSKYLDKSKNKGLFTCKNNNSLNYDYQQISKYNNNLYDIDTNTNNNVNVLKTNLICSDNENENNNNNIQSNSLVCKKRKRSNSLNSILSNISNGTNIVYSYNKNQEKKNDTENINNVCTNDNNDNNDNNENCDNINNDSFCSSNKSKNVFDIDLIQEESKSDISDWNKDLLNNSQITFNDVINSSNINKDIDVFSDINN